MGPGEDDEDEEGEPVDLENFDVPLREWVSTDAPRNEIKRRFRNFLRSYEDKAGNAVYARRILVMCSDNRQTLLLSYFHLSTTVPLLAIWLADAPKDMLEIFNEARCFL